MATAKLKVPILLEWKDIEAYMAQYDIVEVVRCKDCKHQEKTFHADKRMKNGGYYVYFCDLAEEYSHVCLDEDFCSKGERRDNGL